MNKKLIFALSLGIGLIIILIIMLFPKKDFITNKNYIYEISYGDFLDPGNSYIIQITDNFDISVTKKNFCGDVDCKDKYSQYEVDFSKEGRRILKDKLIMYFIENDRVELVHSELDEESLLAVQSIIYNNEKILKTIPSVIMEEKLEYTIISNRVNCPTVSLALYSDNTYRYYYTYGTLTENQQYLEGEYTYEASKIMDKINVYEDDGMGPYIIEHKEDTYITYGSNLELRELLDSIGLNLDVCLTN